MPTPEHHGIRPEIAHLAVDVSLLRPFPGNAKLHDDDALQESLRQHGLFRPIVVRQETGEVLAGNGTYAAALALGWTHIAVTPVSCTDEQATRIVLADNRTHDLGGYDDGLLAQLLRSLDHTPAGHTGTGYDEQAVATLYAQLEQLEPVPAGPNLADRFLVPPFSVLDARQGWWRERKRQWLLTGIQSELGRANDLVGGGGVLHDPTGEVRTRQGAYGAQAKQAPDGTLTYTVTSGATSVFDPVLCEIAYRWWAPPGGRVLDPYAGGSVRGIVAARLGLHYHGIDLRPEQVAANMTQADTLLAGAPGSACWQQGDAGQVLPQLDGGDYDLAFTCPPYYDLEAYSTDPADLSSLDTAAFELAYADHLQALHGALAPDAYAVLVVGSARDKQGNVRDLRALTVLAAQAAGFHLHQDAVLVTPVGSLPVRSAKQFQATRVLGRTHQDVLVLVKGDRKRAAARLGQVDVADALATVHADDEPDPAVSTPSTPAHPPVERPAGGQRPTLTCRGGGPGAREAERLYEATSSLPLRPDWGQVPDELADYLQLIYTGGQQPLTLERTGPAQPWQPLADDGTCWVSFTGGKDSVAAALRAQEQGYRPQLLHVRGLNRGMMDEIHYARALAKRQGWPLHVLEVTAQGKKQGLMELPTKNQVSTLLLLDHAAQHGGAAWTAGWHRADLQAGQGFGYDYSDGDQAIALFDQYVRARYPGATYLGDLWDTTEAWARCAAAGLLAYVKGCVAPVRFKATWRATNERKFGPLLPGRCGSCVKCAWEQVALEALGISEPRPALRAATAKYLLRDFASRTPGGTLPEVLELLVPASQASRWHRPAWPEQHTPPWAPLP